MSKATTDVRGWSRPTQLFVLVQAVLWLVAGVGLWYWRHVAPGDLDKTTLLFNGFPYFDFTIFIPSFAHFHTRAFYAPYFHTPYSYPATAGLMLAFFFQFRDPLWVFYHVMYAIPMAAAAWLGVSLVRRGMRPVWAGVLVCATLAASFPFRFEWQRCNIEIVLFLFVALAVAAYWRGWYWAAAVCIGVVTAAKLYPVTLLGLLVAKRRYKESVATLAVAAGVNALGLWVLGPTVAVAKEMVVSGMNYMRVNVALNYFVLGLDHSLLALLKCFVYFPGATIGMALSPWLTAYVACIAVGGVVLYFLRIVRLPRTNQVMALVVISVLVPPLSYEYTLIHLYVAWAVLLLYVQRADVVPTRPVLWMMALLSVATSPVTTLFFQGVRVGGQVKCIAMIALLVQVLRHPLPDAAAETRMPERATTLPLDAPLHTVPQVAVDSPVRA